MSVVEKTMAKPHRTKVVGLTVVLALLLAACGSATASAKPASKVSKAVTTITYWTSGLTPKEISTLDARFDKTHRGMKVQGQYISSSDEEYPKVVAALKTGTEPPVVLDQNPSDLPLYAESGKLIDLNGKMTALTNALYKGIRNSLFYRGKQLGMALANDGDIVLFYNKKDFKAAGIAAPPKTWTQLEADAVKLSDPAAHRYGIYIPFGDSEWISYDFEALLWANGGNILNNAQTKAVFDSKAGVDALTTWVNMVRKAHTAPDTSYAVAGNYDGSPAFASNVVAMLIDGQWDLSTFESDKLDFGVAEFPKGTVSSATNLGIGVAALFRTTPAQDKVGLAFIKFLASPAQGAYMAATGGGLPSAAAQLSQPVLKKAIASNPYYKVFAETEPFGHVRPISPAYTAVSEDLWDGINAALNGSISPSAALATAQRQANAALASQGS
jgi:ABC-type glycerol-3-phosphate transport system substrate-binding protein